VCSSDLINTVRDLCLSDLQTAQQQVFRQQYNTIRKQAAGKVLRGLRFALSFQNQLAASLRQYL
jgi:hypothetical protein